MVLHILIINILYSLATRATTYYNCIYTTVIAGTIALVAVLNGSVRLHYAIAKITHEQMQRNIALKNYDSMEYVTNAYFACAHQVLLATSCTTSWRDF